jgi:hypothetical protein
VGGADVVSANERRTTDTTKARRELLARCVSIAPERGLVPTEELTDEDKAQGPDLFGDASARAVPFIVGMFLLLGVITADTPPHGALVSIVLVLAASVVVGQVVNACYRRRR